MQKGQPPRQNDQRAAAEGGQEGPPAREQFSPRGRSPRQRDEEGHDDAHRALGQECESQEGADQPTPSSTFFGFIDHVQDDQRQNVDREQGVQVPDAAQDDDQRSRGQHRGGPERPFLAEAAPRDEPDQEDRAQRGQHGVNPGGPAGGPEESEQRHLDPVHQGRLDHARLTLEAGQDEVALALHLHRRSGKPALIGIGERKAAGADQQQQRRRAQQHPERHAESSFHPSSATGTQLNHFRAEMSPPRGGLARSPGRLRVSRSARPSSVCDRFRASGRSAVDAQRRSARASGPAPALPLDSHKASNSELRPRFHRVATTKTRRICHGGKTTRVSFNLRSWLRCSIPIACPMPTAPPLHSRYRRSRAVPARCRAATGPGPGASRDRPHRTGHRATRPTRRHRQRSASGDHRVDPGGLRVGRGREIRRRTPRRSRLRIASRRGALLRSGGDRGWSRSRHRPRIARGPPRRLFSSTSTSIT